MFDLSVEIDGVAIRKRDATVKDYANWQDYSTKYKGENFISNKDAFMAVVDLVADWFDIGTDKLQEKYTLKEILDLYRKLESNIIEVFTGLPAEKTIAELNRIKNKAVKAAQ